MQSPFPKQPERKHKVEASFDGYMFLGLLTDPFFSDAFKSIQARTDYLHRSFMHLWFLVSKDALRAFFRYPEWFHPHLVQNTEKKLDRWSWLMDQRVWAKFIDSEETYVCVGCFHIMGFDVVIIFVCPKIFPIHSCVILTWREFNSFWYTSRWNCT